MNFAFNHKQQATGITDNSHIKPTLIHQRLCIRYQVLFYMEIRSIFERIALEYPIAKKQELKNHPLAKFIRTQVPKSFNENMGGFISKYKVLVAKHAGNWSRVAWIVILDSRISETATRGYYPVYSFFENGKKIMLSLGQGYKDIRAQYKKEADNILISRGIILKNKAGDFKKYGFKNVHGTKITIKKDKEREVWAKSCAFGKIYDVKNLPSNNSLINDLKNMLNIYEEIIQRGGTSELIESIDPEEIDIIKNLSGLEKKALTKHREHEKYYIKTDPKFIKNLKKKFNYTCQACNLKFEKIYGKYNDKLDYVEAHHIVPKSEILKKMDLNEQLGRKESDFAVLCANCHRMIHRYGCPSLDEFKDKIQQDYKNFLKMK